MRSWVRIRSESTVALGQPRLTNPTLGTFFDMTGRASVIQLGKNGAGLYSGFQLFTRPVCLPFSGLGSTVFAQVGRFGRDLQLELAVGRHGEAAAAGEGFKGVATRQFDVQA